MTKVLAINEIRIIQEPKITEEELTFHSKNWESIKGYEEVYARGYDTGGNYHWSGVYSGHHVIKKTLEIEK